MRAKAALLGLCCAGVMAASTITTTVTVAGTAGPWLYSSTLNSTDQYGIDDQTSPVVVGSSSGISFAAGESITMTYLSGTVSAGSGFPLVNALGDTAVPFNNATGSTGRVAPSAYMNPATYPINLVELVGTFANNAGAIVATPFAVGLGASLTIPAGATQLQLGINDDRYGDNVGSFTVQVSGTAIATAPEPRTLMSTTVSLIALLLLCAGRARRIGMSCPARGERERGL